MTTRTQLTAVVTCLLIAAVASGPLAVGAGAVAVGPSPVTQSTVASGAPPADGSVTVDDARPADDSTTVELNFTRGTVDQPEPRPTYVWRSSNKTVEIRVDAEAHSDYEVCLSLVQKPDSPDRGGTNGTDETAGSNATGANSANETSMSIDCREHDLVLEDYQTVDEFQIGGWPVNETGRYVLTATVTDGTTGVELGSANRTVLVVNAGGDFDSDRLTNRREAELGTAINRSDTDADGLQDGPEVLEYGTDPLDQDSDDDGLDDGREISGPTNATNPDTDDDGLDDGVEVSEYDTDPADPDTDDDGLDDGAEVFEYDTDPADPDTDDDGLDDGREIAGPTNATNPDTDGDGLEDGAEVKTYGTDPTESDTDGDGLDDAYEVSMGSDPTNPLTTVFFLVTFVTVLALLFLTVRRLYPGINPFAADGDAEPDTSDDGPEEPEIHEPDPVPPELLSDEDRVLQLLREADGRLPQNEITEQTDWSKSKVSRLLSKMAEDGEIKKIAVGRQNIIALEQAIPENAKSPFDDG